MQDKPSAWLRRFEHLLTPGSTVLDVACGGGRHAHWLAARGHRVTAIDRDATAVAGLHGVAEVIVADLEQAPWPLAGRHFDAIIVTNYLWRPLWPALRTSLAPCGVLLIETFAHGQQFIGRPARPEFLLQPGELLRAFEGLRVVAFEDGFDDQPPRYVQRIVLVDEAAAGVTADQAPHRYGLARPHS
jgi:SAM-dependent methyltransferase